MKVTIDSDAKQESGVSKNGKQYTERWQEAFLHVPGSRFPKSCKLPLYDNARPFPLGDYETDQELEINEYGKLRVKSELQLRHVPAASPAKA